MPNEKGQGSGEEEMSVSGSIESKKRVEMGKESVTHQHVGEGRQGRAPSPG